jgi:hypothetical protein
MMRIKAAAAAFVSLLVLGGGLLAGQHDAYATGVPTDPHSSPTPKPSNSGPKGPGAPTKKASITEWDAKGNPLIKPQTGTKRVLAGGYTYVGGRQMLNSTTTATGSSGNLLVANPYCPNTDHCLTEMSVQDAAQQNTIEIGWNRDFALYGDTKTHLFVYYWIGGVGQGYNALGSAWVDNPSNATNAGADLSSVVSATFPANVKQFIIVHQATQCGPTAGVNGWWLWYDGSAIGCYPDTTWAAGVMDTSTIKVFQWFGEEYSSTTTTPCGDLGNGKGGTSYVAPLDATDPAYIGSTSITNTSPATTTNLSLFATDATKYNATRVSSPGTTTFTYGGPGWNAAGTATGSTGSC